MNPFLSAVMLLAATCLILGLLVVRVRTWPGPRRRRFLEVAPAYRAFFREQGLNEVEDFLDLPGRTPHIISGHPDRHVVRIALGSEDERWIAYLKREHRICGRTRLSNALAGAGFLSRSLREARMLQVLQREGIPGPEWLAVGEDGAGQAFLLVRQTPGMELRTVLQQERNPGRRRRIARNLGALLARLHNSGFRHSDLYANHLLVDPRDDSIRVLDWQRGSLRRTVTWPERRRDLAALHATVADMLASPNERLLCLRTYWRTAGITDIPWQTAIRYIEKQTRRLLNHRHIREKCSLPAQPQAWICLDGNALFATPQMQQQCGERIPVHLQSNLPSLASENGPVRRWPATAEDRQTLLVRRREPLLRRSTESPEQREAGLLLRLQRHGIPAPQALVMGRLRDQQGRTESILLTEPLSDTCSLEAWLACQTRRRITPAQRDRYLSVLREAGTFLRRLHEASCYLNVHPAGCGFAVRETDEGMSVVLDRVDCIASRRRQQPRRARRDAMHLQRVLQRVGCHRSDLSYFHTGYHGAKAKFDIRNIQIQHRRASGFGFLHLGLAFLSDFGVRISGFALLREVRRLYQRPDWATFAGIEWADRIMQVAVTDRFHAKQGRSTGRWILHAPAAAERRARRLAVYLKRHYVLPWWQGLLASLWPGRGWSPALQEWHQLEWARRQGLPVPRTVAAAEYIGPWGRLRSCLAVEELVGMLSLQEAIPLAAVRQDAASFRLWKRSLTAEMARLARMLHDRRCFHKDLYLCHFFIEREDTCGVPEQGWRGRVHLIDLHRLGHHPWSGWFWQTKDLAQLLYSSEMIGVNARDRLHFWRTYRAAGPHRASNAWMRWLILYRWRRYRRHNTRNREGGIDG